jgi:large subunit ribosomal protein L3
VSVHTWVGQKIGMTQIFSEDGLAIPVSVIELSTLLIVQIKTQANDGYSALQVAYLPSKVKHLTKAEQGHFTKNGLPLFRHLMEIRMDEADLASYKVGDVLTNDALVEGLLLDVTGKSIGKGFQGNTKRWKHSRGPMSHGSKSHRLPGSIGAGTTPGRVFKGLKMAGKMGNAQVTVKNLKLVRFIADKNIVLVQGAIPGCEGGYLTLKPKRQQWNKSAVAA